MYVLRRNHTQYRYQNNLKIMTRKYNIIDFNNQFPLQEYEVCQTTFLIILELLPHYAHVDFQHIGDLSIAFMQNYFYNHTLATVPRHLYSNLSTDLRNQNALCKFLVNFIFLMRTQLKKDCKENLLLKRKSLSKIL